MYVQTGQYLKGRNRKRDFIFYVIFNAGNNICKISRNKSAIRSKTFRNVCITSNFSNGNWKLPELIFMTICRFFYL